MKISDPYLCFLSVLSFLGGTYAILNKVLGPDSKIDIHYGNLDTMIRPSLKSDVHDSDDNSDDEDSE